MVAGLKNWIEQPKPKTSTLNPKSAFLSSTPIRKITEYSFIHAPLYITPKGDCSKNLQSNYRYFLHFFWSKCSRLRVNLAAERINSARESDAEFRRRIATEAAIKLAQSGGRASVAGYRASRMMSGGMGMPSMTRMMTPPSYINSTSMMPPAVNESAYAQRYTPSNLANALPVLATGLLLCTITQRKISVGIFN